MNAPAAALPLSPSPLPLPLGRSTENRTASAASEDESAAAFHARVLDVFEPFVAHTADWEAEGHIPRELFAAFGAAGIFRDRWAAGAGGGLPLGRALVDALAPLNGGVALAVSIHCEVFIQALARFGGPRHAALLDAALDGTAIGCVALTEPGGGSDVYSMTTRAVPEPEPTDQTKDPTADAAAPHPATPHPTGRARPGARHWRLTGEKRFTTNVGRASHVLTLARTGAQDGAFTLFVVPLDRPGATVTGFFDTLGMRSADTGGVLLDVPVTEDDVVGRVDGGLMYVLKLLDYERIAAAVGLTAAARAALALATAHLRERTQFGKRLMDHQALAHRLADRWAETQAAAALIDAACRAARGDQLPHHLVAAAKLCAVRTGIAAIDEAIQFLGARGYTEHYPLARMYRDARLARIGGGTDEMLRQIIAMHLDVPDPAASAALARVAADTEARIGADRAGQPVT